jgi:hypothetical protein
MTRPKLPQALRDYHGISPQRRDEMITEAKKMAPRFCWAVKARNAAEVQRLIGGRDCEFLVSLAIVLAEGIKPGDMRLAIVARTPEDDGEKEGAA